MSSLAAPVPLSWEALKKDDIRMLRRVKLNEGPTGIGDPSVGRVGLAIDIETTSLDVDRAQVIELGIRRFGYNEAGEITSIGESWSWLEDPGRPIDAAVVRKTGITSALVAKQAIDDETATRIINAADLVVAFNAPFDRPILERRLPSIAGQKWACAYRQIDWTLFGFEPGKLQYLLMQADLFNSGHRAASDVDSLLCLLGVAGAGGRTALADLLEASIKPTWIVHAEGAATSCGDVLKARGYEWNTSRQVWSKDVVEREREEWWLAANIYTPSANPKRLEADWEPVTAAERWSRLSKLAASA